MNAPVDKHAAARLRFRGERTAKPGYRTIASKRRIHMINIAEFAKRIGINPTLLRNYINGFKTPSKQRTEQIIQGIKELGKELLSAFEE